MVNNFGAFVERVAKGVVPTGVDVRLLGFRPSDPYGTSGVLGVYYRGLSAEVEVPQVGVVDGTVSTRTAWIDRLHAVATGLIKEYERRLEERERERFAIQAERWNRLCAEP